MKSGFESNQTQAQQIGIQQPLHRRPLRFKLLERRHDQRCRVLRLDIAGIVILVRTLATERI
jgi:hypothetical protein